MQIGNGVLPGSSGWKIQQFNEV